MNRCQHQFDVAGLVRVVMFVGIAWHSAIFVEYWPRLLEFAPFASSKYPSRIFAIDLAEWPWLYRAAPLLLFAGILLGVIGLWLRWAAALTFLALYLFYSNNNFGAHNAAQEGIFAMLALMIVYCWGANSLTYKNPTVYSDKRDDPLAAWLIAIYYLNALFSAALAKVIKGHWLQENFLGQLFASPAGVIMRPWWPTSFVWPPWLTFMLSTLIILLQLTAWVWFIFPTTRVIGFVLISVMLLAIYICMAIPLLFLIAFIGGLALVIDWSDLLNRLASKKN